jgi:hypothetical protein
MRQQRTNSKRARNAPFEKVAGALVHNVRERRRTMLYPEVTPVALTFQQLLTPTFEKTEMER